MRQISYCGRFAPSPTGPLHFGSLLAALGSALEAQVQGGRWLLRIEDLDEPRVVPGAADAIIAELRRLGFAWDGEVLRQSSRRERYAEALARLRERGLAYPCGCSRKEIADSSLAPDGARRYPGTCRYGLAPGREARAWRLWVEGARIAFDDRIQGRCVQDVGAEVGDFIVMRADGQFAYQLAVVVDDADQGVTEVVRGADLLDSTPRQVYLQHLLGLPTLRYAHLPVALDASGDKLSKQTLARPVSELPAAEALVLALAFLGQDPPARLAGARVEEVWDWARGAWRMERVPAVRGAPAPERVFRE